MEATKTKLHEVKLRGLELLLRDSGNNSIVVKYSTEPLLPPGENFGSTILKVDAVVKKSHGDEEEKLHMVAKMLPVTDYQRIVFDSSYTFKKEIFFYEELLPTFRKLEREFGFEDEELFDIAPKLIGARYSIKPDSTEVDEDAVILMQNLKSLGYYCMDKRKGFDLIHAKMAVEALARFHSLGIAVKQHMPEVFENIKNRAECMAHPDEFDIDKPRNFFLQTFRENTTISPYYNFLEKALMQDRKFLIRGPPPEPWATIIHSDFWVNNIMFKNKEKVKFVDFQNFLYMSPARELIFCLAVNLNDEVMDNDFDYLLDHYYKNFIKFLKRFRCDTSQFGRDSFEQRLRIDSFMELQHISFILKLMTAEVKKGDGTYSAENVFMETRANPLLEHKMCRLILKFAEKGWILNEDV